MSENYSYVLKTSKNTFSAAPLFEHALLFCNTKLQRLIRFFFFVKVYLASLTWRHGAADKVRVRVRVGGYHLWVQTSKRGRRGVVGWLEPESIWRWLESGRGRAEINIQRFSQVKGRQSVTSWINIFFPSLLHCNYRPRASSWSNWCSKTALRTVGPKCKLIFRRHDGDDWPLSIFCCFSSSTTTFCTI